MTDRAIIHLPWGPQSFQKAVLQPGDRLIIGQANSAGFQILRDKQLGNSQAELSWDGIVGQVQVLNPSDTILIDGQSVSAGPVAPGGWFRIGESTLMLFRERQTSPRTALEPAKAALVARTLDTLRAIGGNLYAVLDAARAERILQLLRESPDESRSLYEGVKGDAMADVAPYLVKLDPQGWLLEALVSEGRGQGWGIYLDCSLPFKEVRRHFRHFLRVQHEGVDGFFYFRFYDPRVLRVFLPTCTVEQLDQLYGPIRVFEVEDEAGELSRFLHQANRHSYLDAEDVELAQVI